MSRYLLTGETTERLIFRNVRPADFDHWLPFYQNPASTQYWTGIPSNPKLACTQQFKAIFNRYEKNLGGLNALIHKNTKTLIGMCGLLLQVVDDVEELEIGYSILPTYWRNGYALEAAQKCKRFAFGNQLGKTLISIIHVDNIPSQKVALKNGMEIEKTTTYKSNPVEIWRVGCQ
ncbi:GCN5-related N-acetyltransferase [Croceitalea dokdonensis DOKDO 023]|uniref:GCN5-related N-acetyltransferase n=1 Tax=Croceitalea dokdonensis DOKDO 023 TaxID=1300341 RepID=A0A0P7AYR8_9FLAO|nr:GNAT family N-acetyltransferase [Croceitalea dokdonensis]KPM30632.1 GCN5-related N-acetyltransferase [Croceitalea dokdonensis DOKDO 023]